MRIPVCPLISEATAPGKGMPGVPGVFWYKLYFCYCMKSDSALTRSLLLRCSPWPSILPSFCPAVSAGRDFARPVFFCLGWNTG